MQPAVLPQLTPYQRKQLFQNLSGIFDGLSRRRRSHVSVVPLPTMKLSPNSKGPDMNDDDFATNDDFGRIKFLHLRYHSRKETNPNNPKGLSGKGGATIAYRRRNDGLQLEWAVTLCNRKDNFNRKVGRLIASNFLDCERKYVLETSPQEDTKMFLQQIVIPKVVNKVYVRNSDARSIPFAAFAEVFK